MAEDRRQIPELPAATTVADGDLLIKRDTVAGEDQQLDVLVLKQEYFGSVVDYDAGEYENNVPILELDDDYLPALPPVSAKKLHNFPAGMNVGELAINVEIDVGGSPFGTGLQFGIADVPNIVMVDFSASPEEAGFAITDALSLEIQEHGIFWNRVAGVTSLNAYADIIEFGADESITLSTPEIVVNGDVNDEVTVLFPSSGTGVNTGGAKIHNVRNLNYKPIAGTVAFNVLDCEYARVVELTLTEDLALTGFDNVQETPAGAVEDHTELVLVVVQDYPGGWNITAWPSNVVWTQGAAPDFSLMDDGEKRVVHFYYDQTTLYGWYPPTLGEIKTAYEANADTNSFTDEEKEKLSNIIATSPINLDALAIGFGQMYLAGDWDASGGTFPFDEYSYGGYAAGGVFRVTVAGTVDGVTFNVGDMLSAIVDDPLDDTYAGNWNRLLGNSSSIEYLGKRVHIVATVMRYYSSLGRWEAIGRYEVANSLQHDHGEIGIDSITSDSAVITVNFDTTGWGSTVRAISFFSQIDEDYAQEGIFCGASVALDSAAIELFKGPSSDYISYNGSAWVSANGVYTMAWSTDHLVLTRVVQSSAYNGTYPSITSRNGGWISQLGSIGTNGDTIDVYFYTFSGVIVTTQDTAMRFFISDPTMKQRLDPNSNIADQYGNLWFCGLFESED